MKEGELGQRTWGAKMGSVTQLAQRAEGEVDNMRPREQVKGSGVARSTSQRKMWMRAEQREGDQMSSVIEGGQWKLESGNVDRASSW